MTEERWSRRADWFRQGRDLIKSIPDLVEFMPLMLTLLPERYQWSLHNLVAHPTGEILYQLGLKDLGDKVHDITVPASKDENHYR